ncbi:MAG: hypothetical protein HeimC3_07320 [Candidatus Heimdallarchaeota archaeon LC_3]|nr:MAG: hypothetical protein HeimC3_07320 [Candidatus Heimdallarchaeota archaeon LC_3]
MTEIIIESQELHFNSCNLDEATKNERVNYLHNDLLKIAKNISEIENVISFEVDFEREITNELIDFVFYENKCCGNFSVNLDFDMVTKSIKVKLSLLKKI